MSKQTIHIQFAGLYHKHKGYVTDLLSRDYRVEISDSPQILFYDLFGSGYEHLKYRDCIKVCMTYEARFPNFNECDYAIGRFDFSFGERYCRYIDLRFHERFRDRSCFSEEDLTKKKFCNFIYGNANGGDGAVLRQQFCKKLMQYKQVDCPGKVLNNMRATDLPERAAPDWLAGKRRFLEQYKFTIAFENQGIEGYFSEKLTDPFIAGSIPIYWGDRTASRIFNSKAFIDATDCPMEEVIERVIELDRDEVAYRQMLMTPPVTDEGIFQVDWEKQRDAFILGIADHGTRLTNQPYLLHDPVTRDAIRQMSVRERMFKVRQTVRRVKKRIEKG